MKILHIVPSYIPAYRYGGPIESVHSLNAGLVKAGADVTVYTTNIDGDYNLDMPIGVPVIRDGVKIFYFKGFRNRFLRSWFYSSGMRKALAENGGNFDIFHITSTFLFASVLGAHYAKKFQKLYVISPRGNLMKSPLKRNKIKWLKKLIYIFLIEGANLSGADAIHFTVPLEKDDYVKEGFKAKKCIVLPNIIDISKFNNVNFIPNFLRAKFNLPSEKRIVIYLGRLNWIKGFDTLIPAFKKVITKEANAVLVIVGGDDSGYKKEILNFAKENNIEKNIIFTGMLTGNEKVSALRDADVFVLPSYSESFGMSAVEAMSVELPVIVTKGVGIAPYITQANAGMVVEKNEGDLSEAILHILKDGHLGKEMGKRGKKMIGKEFSQDEIAKKFLDEYEFIIKNH